MLLEGRRAIPLRERIQDRNLIGLEIGHVPSDERQTMMQRGGGEEPVRNGNRLMDAQLAPAEGDRFIDREDARREARSKAVEPRFKMNGLGGVVKVKPPRSPPDFTQRDDTQVEQGIIHRLDPFHHALVPLPSPQFGDDVGIEEKPAHSSISRGRS